MALAIPPELPKFVEALPGLAWPVLAAIFLWKILPSLLKVIDSRQFTIKLGGMEVSVQEASENLVTQVDDLQQRVTELRAALDERGTPTSPPIRDMTTAGSAHVALPEPSTAARRILWVDDQPKNNVFEIAKLKAEGIDVIEVTSTSDTMRYLVSGREMFGLCDL